jgi:hypothetical protein
MAEDVSRPDPASRQKMISIVWILTRGRESATCEAWSHEDGFELRLKISGDPLPRLQVCKSEKEMDELQQDWREGMERTGWRGDS